LEGGGKRSATPLWTSPVATKGAVVASLCRRTCFIAQHRHLGRDKRMLEQMNVAGWMRFIHRDDLNRTAFAGEAKSRTTAPRIHHEKTPECNGVIP
jgi:hypothetical protein